MIEFKQKSIYPASNKEFNPKLLVRHYLSIEYWTESFNRAGRAAGQAGNTIGSILYGHQ